MDLYFDLTPTIKSFLLNLYNCVQADSANKLMIDFILSQHKDNIYYKSLLKIHQNSCPCHLLPLHQLLYGSGPKFGLSESSQLNVFNETINSHSKFRQNITKLKIQQHNQVYQRMVKNILPPQTYSDINPQFISNDVYTVVNYLFTVIGVYVFAYMAYGLFYQKSVLGQLLFGLICSTLIAIAEFYILVKMNYF